MFVLLRNIKLYSSLCPYASTMSLNDFITVCAAHVISWSARSSFGFSNPYLSANLNRQICPCYNSETWTLTAETNRQLRVFEIGCLRQIMDVTRRDHIKNVDIRANCGITEDIVGRIQARRLRYFSHLVRMDQHRLPNIEWKGRESQRKTQEALAG